MFKIDVKTKKGTREIKKVFVPAGNVRKMLKFFTNLEKNEDTMDNLEVAEGFVNLVLDLFPEDKKLEDDLWDNYEFEELMEFCQDVVILAQGGKLEEGDKDSPSAE